MFASLLGRKKLNEAPPPERRTVDQAIPEYLFYTPERIERFRRLDQWRAENYKNELDSIRVHLIIRLLEQVSALPGGDYVEMGTQYGGTAKIIYDQMLQTQHLYCFDTFEGFAQQDLDEESKITAHGFTTSSIKPLAWEAVRDIITDKQPSSRLTMIPGRVPETLGPYADRIFRFAHLDMDLHEPTRAALDWLWPRMEPRAVILLHDYDCLIGVKKAVDDFCDRVGQVSVPLGDRFGSVVVTKPHG
ncbi:class I SAM-dependent methyltransferase [Microbacteriaceae bacterium K1510]|nr:class I SAM-dependent methyltransferase [Microbacteriaceae bacterium K1510]